MKIRLKKDVNAWANGEIVYTAGKDYDVDARFAQELIETGKFEPVSKKSEKEEAKESK